MLLSKASIPGFCLLLVLVPVFPWSDGKSHDGVRLMQLLAGLLLLGSLTIAALRDRSRISTLPGPAVFGLFLIGTCSVVSATRPELALREFSLLIMALLAVWPRESAGRTSFKESQQIAIYLLTGGAALYAALELLLIVSGLLLNQTLDCWQVFAGYVNPRFFNHVQTLLIPLLVGVTGLPGLRPLWRHLAWFALSTNTFFLLLLTGRATLLALMVSSLLALLIFGAMARRYVIRLLQAFAVGAVLHVLLIKLLPFMIGMEALPAFRELGERGSVEARFYLWRLALDMIQAHPLLGVGPMHYAARLNDEAAHPHNIYLQIAAEYGLPFFFLLIFLGVRWLIRTTQALRKHLSQSGDPLALACYAAVIGALVDGGFSGNFVMPLSQLWIVFTLILLGWRLQPQATSVPVQQPLVHRILCRVVLVMLFIAQLSVVLHSVPEFLQTHVRLTNAIEQHDADHYSPRFWRDGWF